MNRKFIIVADDSIKGFKEFDEEIAKLEREWGAEEIESSEDAVSREAVLSLQTEYAEKMGATTFWELRDDIRALPSVTPTNEDIKEAYLKGYDYGVKDWFISKTHPSEDCISRQAVIEYTTANYGFCPNLIDEIKAMPPVTPQRPKGKWIEYEVDVAPHPLHCSLCGFSNHHISNRYMREFRRCPNCGAEMEGEDDK